MHTFVLLSLILYTMANKSASYKRKNIDLNDETFKTL